MRKIEDGTELKDIYLYCMHMYSKTRERATDSSVGLNRLHNLWPSYIVLLNTFYRSLAQFLSPLYMLVCELSSRTLKRKRTGRKCWWFFAISIHLFSFLAPSQSLILTFSLSHKLFHSFTLFSHSYYLFVMRCVTIVFCLC